MKKEKEIEKCVLCGEETTYTKDVPIYMRFFYIEGMGQLCSKCYERLNGSVSKR